MTVWKSLAGMADVELTSAEMEAALTAVNEMEIEIHRLRQTGMLSCRFLIHRRDLTKLETLCRKRGEKLEIRKRVGLYWLVQDLKRRPVLLLGLTICLAAVLMIPTRVFFVQVKGNERVPTRRILAAAADSGICFGASRRAVRSEKMKNDLLALVPELEWAGVNTAGCVAVISVREGSEVESTETSYGVSHIQAVRDGYILSGTAVKGTALFYPGQAVKAGQILISGYTDCGLCIRAGQAEGEIFALTNRSIRAVMPEATAVRGEKQAETKKYSILFGKKRINLWKGSGISDATCGRMYKEYYLTLPGGFRLPAALCVDTWESCDLQQETEAQPDGERELKAFAAQWLQTQMISGMIQDSRETVVSENGCYVLTGEYQCTEMIGRISREQIGDINGKSG